MSNRRSGKDWEIKRDGSFSRTGHAIRCDGCRVRNDEIERLREENRRLKQRIHYHEKKSKTEGAFGNSTPSSQIPVKKAAKVVGPKGGAKKGHVGSGRRSGEVGKPDYEVPPPNTCPECCVPLHVYDSRERTIVEAAPVKAKRIVIQVNRSKCPSCFKRYTGAVHALPRFQYGNRLLSQAAVMHYLHGIPMRRLLELFGPEVTEGGIHQALQNLSSYLEPAIAELTQQFREASVKHVDETGWRVDGQSGWAWIFCNPNIAIFKLRNTRSRSVWREVLGEEAIQGTLVVDRYPGYKSLPGKVQHCYAHILRDVEKVKNEFTDVREILTFSSTLIPILSECMGLRNQEISDKEFYKRARELKKRIIQLVETPAKHEGIRHIQRIFKEYKHRLYHWVDDRSVPPENNRAERELRRIVVSRKVSFGSQSLKGARTRETWMSFLHSARLRLKGKPIDDWLFNFLNELAMGGRSSALDQIGLSTPRH